MGKPPTNDRPHGVFATRSPCRPNPIALTVVELYVAEREWHPSQHLRTLPGGDVELTFHAGGNNEIVRWILGWGDAVEVLRPAPLRQAVAEQLRNAAHIYAE